MARYGITVDLGRCTGCMTCVIACKEENLTRPKVWWNRILELESKARDRITYFRYACMHCDDPPCREACLHSAIYKRPDGIVLVDHKKCEGARDCAKACPYGVMDINPAEEYFPGQSLPYEKMRHAYQLHPPGRASTCTLCVHRIDQGKEPVCVSGCPSKAMIFGDLDDPDSPIQKKVGQPVRLLSSEGTHPKVFYIVHKTLLGEIERMVLANPKMVR